jgi:hypothetical protein
MDILVSGSIVKNLRYVPYEYEKTDDNYNRKIVRRIAFQYWIAFMVALEEGYKIPDLVLLKDFFSMLIMNLKMRSVTNTDRAPIEKNSIYSITM